MGMQKIHFKIKIYIDSNQSPVMGNHVSEMILKGSMK